MTDLSTSVRSSQIRNSTIQNEDIANYTITEIKTDFTDLGIANSITISGSPTISGVSNDPSLSGDSNSYVLTEHASKQYFDDNAITDHTDLTGLGVDDHTQYLPTDGSRPVTGNLTVQGNLTVSGTQFIANVEEVLVEDNIMVLNYGETGAGVTAGEAGVEIDRGSLTNYRFIFDETSDNFRIGVSGTEQAVATREDSPTDQYLGFWNDSQKRFDTSGGMAVGDVASISYVTTVSGDLQINIDNKADDVDVDNINQIFYDMNEPTGFINRTDSGYSFNNGNRTLTISGTYSYYIDGTKYNKNGSNSKQITDIEGWHFFYYNGTTLSETTTLTNDLILNKAAVAVVYWDFTNKEEIYLGEERHGITMDGSTHLYLHETRGAAWEDGLAITGILADQSGNDNSHAQCGYSLGTIWDEDIDLNIASQSAPATFDVFYKDGASANWRSDAGQSYPVKSFSGGSGRLAYNQFTGGAWQQTEVGNGDFVLAHLFATNDLSRTVVAIQGENQYSTRSAARAAAADEIYDITHGNVAWREIVPLATIIYETKNTFSNAKKARIVSTDEGDDYIDFRYSSGGGTGSTTNDHGNLAGLDDDDHLQYYDTTRLDSWWSTASGTIDHDTLLNFTQNEHFTEASIDHTNITAGDGTDHSAVVQNTADIVSTSGTLQTQIDAKDNYASWSFAVDGVTKDAITSGDIFDIVGGPNITVTRSAEDQITISGTSNGVVDELPVVQIRRSTNLTLPFSWADIVFDITDVENYPQTLEHDNSNTERINIGDDGLYMVSYACSVDPDPDRETFDFRVLKNGATVISGSERQIREDDEINDVGNVFFANLEDGDYITFQVMASDGTNVLIPESTYAVMKTAGVKGADGQDGVQGPAGSGSTVHVYEEGSPVSGTPFNILDFIGPEITANSSVSGTATITVSIDHDTILNTHNLTTDIDHDQLTNYAANEHFTEASIDHANIIAGDGTDHSAVTTNTALIATTSGTLQTAIDAKDNYASWSFAVDGVTKDAITSGDVFDIVGGDNITVTRTAEDQITISGSAGGDHTHNNYYETITSWTVSGTLYYKDVVHNRNSNDLLIETYTIADNKTVHMEDIERIDLDTVRVWSATNTEDVRILVCTIIQVGNTFNETISGWTVSGDRYYGDITHNLSTNDIMVHTYIPSTGLEVGVDDIERLDTDTLRVYSTTNTDSIRVLIAAT